MKHYMHNPERKKYTKGIRGDGGCYFCGKEMKEQYHIKEYEHWYLVANKFPFIDYALLAIPKRHTEFVTDLKTWEWAELQDIFNETLTAWKSYYLTNYPRSANERTLDGDLPSWNIVSQRFPDETYGIDEEMTTYINNGEHSGRTVPHLHWNIVPRIYIRRTGLEVMSTFQKVKATPQDTATLFRKLLNEE